MGSVSATTEPSRRAGDLVMSRLARVLVRAFFRQIDVAGADQLPADRPVVLVANHVNGLVDGLVLMAALDRYPRFLGKSTLFKIVPLAPFLRLAGVVPVYRASDGVNTERNDEAFRTSRALLAQRGLVALFPEGISHDEARVQPLRTGAARIALGAAFDAGVTDLLIVPVGLIYDDKARFRSRALVRIGRPASLDTWAQDYDADPTRTVRAVTAELAVQLWAVGPMFESRQDELVLHRIAGIVAPTRGPLVDLAARDEIARSLHEAEAAEAATPGAAAVADLRARAERYEQALGLLGVTDAQVASGLTTADYHQRLRRSLAVATLSAPVALVGAVAHAVPYGIKKQIGTRPPNEGMRATVKLLGCFTLFTTVYTILGVMVGRRRGPLAGLAAFLGGPASGFVSVRFAERVQRIGGVAHARAVLGQGADALPQLLAERAGVVDAARAILTRSTDAIVY